MANRSKNANIKVSLEGDPKGIINAATSAQHAINKLTKELGVSRQEATAFVNNFDKLDRVKGFQQLQNNLKNNQTALAAAKQRARELAAEYRQTGDAMAKLGAEGSQERVQRLSAEIRQQTEALRTEGDALRSLGVDTKDLAGAQKKLTEEIDAQERGWKAAAAASKRAEQMAEVRARADKVAADVLKRVAAQEKRATEARKAAEAATRKKIAQDRRYQQSLQKTAERIRRLINEQSRAAATQDNFTKKIKSSFGGLDSAVSGVISKWSALLGGAGLGVFAKLSFDAGASAQSIETSFEVIFGSAEAGAAELEFVRKTAKDLNLEFESTVGAYRQLAAASQGTALAGKPTRDIFIGIAQASTVLGLSADQTSGALKAVEQMISKGKVQAEELRGQLGERLPGAFALSAKAMGVTTAELDKMLKAGEVTAEDLLPKLALALQDRFAGGVEKAKNNAVQSINALKNAWYDFRVAFAESGFLDFGTGKIRDLSAALADPKVQQAAKDIGKAVADIGAGIYDFIKNNKDFLVVMGMVATGLYGVEKAMKAYAVAAKLVAVSSKASLATLGQIAVVAGSLAAIYKAVDAYGEMRDAQKMAAESAKRAEAAEAKYQDRLSRASKAAGKQLKSYKAVQEAYRQGVIDYDRLTDTYSKGSGIAREAAEDSKKAAEEQQKVFKFVGKSAEESTEKVKLSAEEQKKALAVLKKEYKSLVKEIESVDKQLTKLADEGAADQLKLANASRSPLEAWKAQRQAALDLGPAMAAAKAEADKLAAAGDIEGANKSYARAVALGQQMREGFKELAVEVKGNFTPAMQQGLDVAKDAAKDFGDQYKKSMDEAKKAGDKLKSTTESLASAQQDLADAQRDHQRESMSDAQAYQDIASEQKELEEASKAAAEASRQAAASGDAELANKEVEKSIALAQKAKQVAEELNQEVKNGEKVVVSAEQARKNAYQASLSARQLEIEALKIKQSNEAQAEFEALARAEELKAAKEAEAAKVAELEAKKSEVVKTEAEAAEEAAKLEAEARQQITEILQAQKDVLTELADQKNAEADWTLGDAYTQAGEDAKALFEVNQNIQQQLKDIPADAVIDWGSAWSQIEAAGVKSAAEVEAKWDQATRDRYITTYVREVQQRSGGGFAGPVQGLAAGGQPRRLSSRYITGGAGGVDRFGPVMLDHREFVLQRRSVHAPELGGDGLALAWAHNRQDWGGMHSLLSKHLGPPQISLDLPAVPAELSGGGRADRRGGDERTLVFRDPATRTEAKVTGSRFDLDVLERQLKHRGIVSSR